MAWDAEMEDLLPHTVTLTAPGNRNAYGRLIPGASPSTRAALVEYKMRLVRTLDGTETSSSITVYLSGSGGVSGITPEWTLTLPDSTSRPILSVDRYADDDGDLYEVVHLA
jgi:hypothetical protein